MKKFLLENTLESKLAHRPDSSHLVYEAEPDLCSGGTAILRTLALFIAKPVIYRSCVSFSNSALSPFKRFVGGFLRLVFGDIFFHRAFTQSRCGRRIIKPCDTAVLVTRSYIGLLSYY